MRSKLRTLSDTSAAIDREAAAYWVTRLLG